MINASETIVDGALCVENYHAILEHVNSSIRDSLKGKGARVAVLNDEAHHVANETGQTAGKWKEFLRSPDYGFRHVLGVSGTCYVGDEYFSDVLFRYSLQQEAAAQLIEAAVERVLSAGYRTADIAAAGDTPVSTDKMGDLIVAAINEA